MSKMMELEAKQYAEPKCERCGHEMRFHEEIYEGEVACMIGVAEDESTCRCRELPDRPPTTEPAESEGG